jgi:hypothetical protein
LLTCQENISQKRDLSQDCGTNSSNLTPGILRAKLKFAKMFGRALAGI